MLYQDEHYWETRPKEDKKMDWNYMEDNWVSGYTKSVNHPHRERILQVLESMYPFESVYEVGCNSGPNLLRIKERFSHVEVSGIDASPVSVKEAQEHGLTVSEGLLYKLPLGDKQKDILLADAVLMYVDDARIDKAMEEFSRVTNKGMVFVEWFDESEKGVLKDYHWARNYPKLMEKYGFEVICNKSLTESDWPTPKWVKNGRLFACLRPLQTSKKS